MLPLPGRGLGRPRRQGPAHSELGPGEAFAWRACGARLAAHPRRMGLDRGLARRALLPRDARRLARCARAAQRARPRHLVRELSQQHSRRPRSGVASAGGSAAGERRRGRARRWLRGDRRSDLGHDLRGSLRRARACARRVREAQRTGDEHGPPRTAAGVRGRAGLGAPLGLPGRGLPAGAFPPPQQRRVLPCAP